MTPRAAGVSVVAVGLVVLVALAALPPPAAAQAAQDVEVATDYPIVAVEPGERVTLDLEVTATPAAPVELGIDGAPEGWDHSLRGGGFVVGGVFAGPEDPPPVQLETTVPDDAEQGAHTLEVTATADNGVSDTLIVEFRVQEGVSGEPALSAEFPTLQGSADTTFSYDLELDNPTPREQTFALEASGPQGWQVSANPAGEEAAATVTVAAGQTERVSVEAEPPPEVTAGSYPIVVRATGGEQPVETELTAEVTGSYDVVLSTPDERLSMEATPGEQAQRTMVVRNAGSAPVQDVQLQASPPSGWEASFEPETVNAIPPGEAVEVAFTVTPSEEAVVGDYRVTLSANAAQASDQVEMRTSLETSAGWGIVGVGLIVAALGALGGVFRIFGRR